jgi:cytochrome bd ubiquinol oxidase subunit II
MFLALAALILRPVSFKFHSEVEYPLWRSFWDFALFISGTVAALIFGVAVGNAPQGVPFRLDDSLRMIDDSLRMIYEGGLLGLLNPFALLCGLVSCVMFVMHGGAISKPSPDSPARSGPVPG